MRAKKAYIASFGTTGTLIAAALLTMSVMSAIVAFNGFPGQSIQDPIGSVQVQERQAPLSIEKHPAAAKPTAARHAHASSARHAGRHGRATHATAPVAHANPVVHRQSNGQQKQAQQPSSGSSPVSVPDTSSVTKGVTDAVPTPPSVPPAASPLPSYPVTLPGSDQKQLPLSLPVDTSGVTNTVNAVLGQ